MKKCYKCKEIKPLDDYYKSKERYDGIQAKCKKCCYLSLKRYQNNNRQIVNEQVKKWQSKNKDKRKASGRKHRIENPGKYNAYAAKRKAKKLLATPKWLTKEHLKEIEEIYELCSNIQWLSEEKLEVDHIIPLQGKEVSGLHVPWNLQIMSASKNRSKGNKI